MGGDVLVKELEDEWNTVGKDQVLAHVLELDGRGTKATTTVNTAILYE